MPNKKLIAASFVFHQVLLTAYLRAAETSPEAIVNAFVAQLDSKDPELREKGEWGLEGEGVSFDDVPLLEKALASTDLTPRQRSGLKRALKWIKPHSEQWVARRVAREPVENARYKLMTGAYELDGHKNVKWDATVAAMFKAREKQAETTNVRASNALGAEAAKQAKLAMDAGCDDPDFLVEAGLTRSDYQEIGFNSVEAFVKARDNFNGGRVSLLSRTIALGRILRAEAGGYDGGITDATEQKIIEQFTDMTASYQQLASVPGMDSQVIVDVAQNVWSTGAVIHADRVQLYKNVGPPLDRFAPDNPQALCIKGDYYIAWGYVARGMGFANTVTPQGWKDFSARVELAADAFSAAYDADPLCSYASEMMVEVEIFRHNDRSVMEKWFDRAMAVAEDPEKVALNKATYLEPKWHGSEAELIKFGDECVDRDKGRTAVTMEPLQVHLTLSKLSDDSDGYLSQAEVYSDVSAACRIYLKRHPEIVSARCWYAKMACLNGDWKIADEQFKLIGPKISGNAFKSQAEADRLAAKAARRAAE